MAKNVSTFPPHRDPLLGSGGVALHLLFQRHRHFGARVAASAQLLMPEAAVVVVAEVRRGRGGGGFRGGGFRGGGFRGGGFPRGGGFVAVAVAGDGGYAGPGCYYSYRWGRYLPVL